MWSVRGLYRPVVSAALQCRLLMKYRTIYFTNEKLGILYTQWQSLTGQSYDVSSTIKHGCHCSTLCYTSSYSPKQPFLAFKVDSIFRCEELTLHLTRARTYPFVLNAVCTIRSLITRCKSCEPNEPTTSPCNKLASVMSTAYYNEAGATTRIIIFPLYVANFYWETTNQRRWRIEVSSPIRCWSWIPKAWCKRGRKCIALCTSPIDHCVKTTN